MSLAQTSPTLLDFLTRMIHCKINPSHAKEPQPQHLTNRGVYTRRKGATKHVAVLVWHQHSPWLPPNKPTHVSYLAYIYVLDTPADLSNHLELHTPPLHHRIICLDGIDHATSIATMAKLDPTTGLTRQTAEITDSSDR